MKRRRKNIRVVSGEDRINVSNAAREALRKLKTARIEKKQVKKCLLYICCRKDTLLRDVNTACKTVAEYIGKKKMVCGCEIKFGKEGKCRVVIILK